MMDEISRRDDWKARASLYSDGSRLVPQKCEDLAARRILVGLGYTEQGINKLEAALELAYDASKPLFDRAKTILEVVGAGMFSSDRKHRKYVIGSRHFDKRHRSVLDDLDNLVEMASNEEKGVMLFGRVENDRVAWGYCILPDTEMPPWLLQPPSVLIARKDGYWVWYRELSDLVHDMARFEHWEVPGSVDFDPTDPRI